MTEPVVNHPVFTVSRNLLFILIAVILFAVGFVLILTDNTNAKVIQLMLYGGLTAFAIGHL